MCILFYNYAKLAVYPGCATVDMNALRNPLSPVQARQNEPVEARQEECIKYIESL